MKVQATGPLAVSIALTEGKKALGDATPDAHISPPTVNFCIGGVWLL